MTALVVLGPWVSILFPTLPPFSNYQPERMNLTRTFSFTSDATYSGIFGPALDDKIGTTRGLGRKTYKGYIIPRNDPPKPAYHWQNAWPWR